jgi:hypothetical protein
VHANEGVVATTPISNSSLRRIPSRLGPGIPETNAGLQNVPDLWYSSQAQLICPSSLVSPSIVPTERVHHCLASAAGFIIIKYGRFPLLCSLLRPYRSTESLNSFPSSHKYVKLSFSPTVVYSRALRARRHGKKVVLFTIPIPND